MNDRIPIDVITCDPRHYVRCAHMLSVIDLLPPDVQEIIERREWTLRTRDGLRAFRLLDVRSIPTLCVDGRKCFENQVPTVDELYLALATAARTEEQREVIHRAWSRTNEEYEPHLAELAKRTEGRSPSRDGDSPGTVAGPGGKTTPSISLPEDPDSRQAVDIIRALGHPLRFGILQLLALSKTGGTPHDPCGTCGLVCTTRLRTVFDVSAPDLNHHMKMLRQAGLIETHRDRAWVHYELRPESLEIVANAVRGLMEAATVKEGAPVQDGCRVPESMCQDNAAVGRIRETLHK